jgi:NTE family protein
MFQAQGRLPRNLAEVNERGNNIRYSRPTRTSSNAFRDRHDVRHAINELHKLLPPNLANTEQAKRLQLVYRPTEPQGASKVCEFSRSSMEVRWQQGISNARTALHASPWRAPTPRELGVRVFDVM